MGSMFEEGVRWNTASRCLSIRKKILPRPRGGRHFSSSVDINAQAPAASGSLCRR